MKLLTHLYSHRHLHHDPSYFPPYVVELTDVLISCWNGTCFHADKLVWAESEQEGDLTENNTTFI